MISIFNVLLKRCQLLQNLVELDSYFASVSLKLKIIGMKKPYILPNWAYIRLGHNKPFHGYPPSKPSYDQPGQGLLQKKLIWNTITTSSLELKFACLLPNVLPQGQVTEVPFYFEIFNVKVDGQTIQVCSTNKINKF